MRTKILLLVACACGGTEGTTTDAATGDSADIATGDGDPNKSGDRIKLKFLESTDGARLVTGMHDLDRGEDCAFSVASDGQTRCLPKSYGTALQEKGYFADAACTTPAAAVEACATPPKYVFLFPPPSCLSSPPVVGPEVYLRGTTMTSAYRKDVNNQCISTGLSLATTYYGLGAKVSASEFQAAEIKTGE